MVSASFNAKTFVPLPVFDGDYVPLSTIAELANGWGHGLALATGGRLSPGATTAKLS
jgi:hypothetical protein